MCSDPEVDDTLPGWVVGKAVGYCSICTIESDSENGDDSQGNLLPDDTNDSSDEHPAKRLGIVINIKMLC
jgi:hypothetical protein